MGIDNDIDCFDFSGWDINEELFDSDIADSYNIDESMYICNYKTIPGYDNYIIYRDGKIENTKRRNEYLKHTIPKRGGPRVKLSKKGKKGVSFLVAKILISVFKSNDYDFIKDKAIVHYRDHNPGNISLENIFIELK